MQLCYFFRHILRGFEKDSNVRKLIKREERNQIISIPFKTNFVWKEPLLQSAF